MKLGLKISLAANLISFAVILTFLIRAEAPFGHQLPSQTPSLSISSHLPAVQETSGSIAFSWRQIESADYRTYLANLRSIGCPSQTIADILRADIHDLYKRKRVELGLAEQNAIGPWSRVEEEQAIQTLLGSQEQVQTNVPTLGEVAPVLPMVLRSVDPEVLQLDQGQQTALTELQEEFIRQVGGANQDPADPAYAERWQRAQPANDRLLRGMIGINAYMRYQNEAQ